MSYICRQYKVGYTVRSFPIESIHALTKHIEVHYHYVRECLHAGDIDLVYVPTQNNVVDIFTKVLPRKKV